MKLSVAAYTVTVTQTQQDVQDESGAEEWEVVGGDSESTDNQHQAPPPINNDFNCPAPGIFPGKTQAYSE